MLRYSFIFLFLLLTSCASRKVAVVKNDTKITIDSNSVVKKDEVITTQNNVTLNTDIDEMEICPLSDSIPMVVNGIAYKNAKLKYKKTKVALIDTTKKEEIKKESKKVNVVTNKREKTLEKKIDKKANNWWWIWILLLAVLIYYAYKKVNKTLF